MEHEHHHDHDHAHEHEHEHHHHHEHDHEHEHHHGPVTISHHEGAVIGGMRGIIREADYDRAEKLLSAQLREAARRVAEAGGIVGHIKFVVSALGQCGQISVTEETEQVRRFEAGCCRAEGVAIVFAVEDEALEHILLETVGTVVEPEEG